VIDVAVMRFIRADRDDETSRKRASGASFQYSMAIFGAATLA